MRQVADVAWRAVLPLGQSSKHRWASDEEFLWAAVVALVMRGALRLEAV